MSETSSAPRAAERISPHKQETEHMDYLELTRRKAAAWSAMGALRALATAENRDLTPAEMASFERHEGELRTVSAQLAPHEAARMALIQGGPSDRSAGEFSARAIPIPRGVSMRSHLASRGMFTPDPEREALSFGQMLRGIITGEWSGVSEEARALSHVGAEGGYAVPLGIYSDIVDRMRQKARVLEAGAELVELTAGRVPIPKLTGAVTASWHLDGQTIADSDPTFGETEMIAKTLTSLVKIPIGLVDDAPMLGRAVERELAGAMALELDRVAMYGDGASGEPVGIVNTAGVASVTGGAIASYAKLLDLEEDRLDNGADWATAAVLSNRTWRTFAGLVSGITNDLSPLTKPAELESLRFLPTGQVLTTEGAGSNEARVFVGGFSEILVGVRMSLTLKVLDQAYIANGLVGVLAIWRGDIAIPRPGALGMLTAVTN